MNTLSRWYNTQILNLKSRGICIYLNKNLFVSKKLFTVHRLGSTYSSIIQLHHVLHCIKHDTSYRRIVVFYVLFCFFRFYPCRRDIFCHTSYVSARPCPCNLIDQCRTGKWKVTSKEEVFLHMEQNISSGINRGDKYEKNWLWVQDGARRGVISIWSNLQSLVN